MGSELAFKRPIGDSAKYELLRELGRGYLGRLALGRALSEGDAGRFVVLRELPAGCLNTLEPAVRTAASVAHPRLVKVLGVAWIDGAAYLASEHIDGVPLCELTQLSRAADTSLLPEVAIRIVLDLVLAADAARQELGKRGANTNTRYVYPDTAWVAVFGETLLSEAGLAAELCQTQTAAGPRATLSSPEEVWGQPCDARTDVFAAGALLWELLSGCPLPPASVEPIVRLDALQKTGSGAPVSTAVADLVALALSASQSDRFASAAEMAHAIQSLPPGSVGTEAQVRAAVEPLLHALSREGESRLPLDLSSGQHSIDPWESPTRSLRGRVRAGDDRITLKPVTACASGNSSTMPVVSATDAVESTKVSGQPTSARRIGMMLVPLLLLVGAGAGYLAASRTRAPAAVVPISEPGVARKTPARAAEPSLTPPVAALPSGSALESDAKPAPSTETPAETPSATAPRPGTIVRPRSIGPRRPKGS